MNYIGKILVVLLLVMSVLFMTLAGAVFAVHTNWKQKYEKQVELLEGEKKNVAAAQSELNSVRQTMQKSVDDANAKASASDATVTTLTTQNEALKKKNNEDQQELQTQTALAEAKALEADFREKEAQEQRAANRALQTSLDDTAAKLRQKEDDMFALQVEYDNVKDQFNDNRERLAFLERVVRLANLETDPKVIAKRQAPPPPVDGLVKVVEKDRTNRPKYVEITVGSDDGLLTGHIMDVLRIGVGGKDPQYLGKVRIISIEPDSAVCEVVEAAKNGIIEEGDNVTTKL